MNETLFSKIQNVLLDLVCNKSDTMTVDDATFELLAIFEATQQSGQADGEGYVPYSNHAPNVYVKNVLPPFPPR